MEISPKQLNKLKTAAKIVEKGDFAIIEKILEFEDFIEELIENYNGDKEKISELLEEYKELKSSYEDYVQELVNKSSERNIDDKLSQTSERLMSELNTSINENINTLKGLFEKRLGNTETINNIKQNEMLRDLEDIKEEIDELSESIPEDVDLSVVNALNDRVLKIEERLSKDISKEIDDKLEELSDELKKYIDSRPKTEVTSRPFIGGRVGLQVYNSSTKVNTKVNEINFGTGLTAYIGTDKRVTVITTDSTSGYQTPSSGSVNGSNTTFVWTLEPKTIVVDGLALNKVSTDGTVNWTGTTTTVLTVAPNNNIFAVS